MDPACGASDARLASDDDVVAAATAKAQAARTVMEAFENTAEAMRQYGIERIRIRGLSQDCPPCADGDDDNDDGGEAVGEDGVRIISEQQFMREFVFHSRPCVILGAVDDWPAMDKWRDDRYLFDLDHNLPSEEEVSSSSSHIDSNSDEEEESTDGEQGARDETKKPQPSAGECQVSATCRRGPKRITVALTPNGRADAVTHALYDTADVPAEACEEVFAGSQAQKEAVLLAHHSALAEGDVMNHTADGGGVHGLRGEKLFMYAAEVKVTLPELYTLLQRSPTEPLAEPDTIDMRAYKQPEQGPVVAYAQLQNNCLNTEYQHLHSDLKRNVERFGNRIFGGVPEAANVWFGIPTSVSSMHQDWVENLYPVIRGVKEFTLLPPWEGVFVPKPEIPSAGFAIDEARSDRDKLKFYFKPYPAKDGTLVPWMDLDFTPAQVESEDGDARVLSILCETIDDNESRKKTCLGVPDKADADGDSCASTSDRFAAKKPKEVHPIVAHVGPGETLYLPSMWLHRVSQRADERDIRARAKHKANARAQAKATGTEGTETEATAAPPLPLIAAVNYWYDMSFTNPAVVMLREFGLLL